MQSKSAQMGLLNRLILPLAPELACKREAWRQLALRSFYTAADRGARSAGWTMQNATGELTNQGERDVIRARSRYLERNSDIMSAEILAFERNVVGTGIVLQAKVLGSDGKEDDALNTRIEELWREWCKPGSCEMTGRFSLSEIEALCLRRRFVDGGVLILKVYADDAFKLQLLEVDDLDGTMQSCRGNRVVGGVEIDDYRRALAYHIKIYDAWGFSVETRRVSADRVIYLPYLTRPSQIREVSPATASLGRIDDINELIDAAVEKERMLAHLSVVVEKERGTITGLGGIGRGGSAAPSAESAVPQEILEQGTITYLNPGEKISTVAPAGTSSTVEPMVRTTQRLAGGGAGLSYEVVSRDMSQVTYSSARQGLLEDQKTYKALQTYLIDHFCDVIFNEWLDWMVLSGRLQLRGYFDNPCPYRRHFWIASGWDWIDPVKEANANRTALETNQTTLQEICASKGKDYRDVISQRALEKELLKAVLGDDADKVGDMPTSAGGGAETDDKDSAAASVAAEGKSIQTVSLNGAQLDSLVAIVQMVVVGTFPYLSAVALLTSAFPFDEATAQKILNDGKQIKISEGDEDDKKTGA